MALFQTKVKFNTYEHLVDMLELSNFMFNHRKEQVDYSGSVYEHVPKFTFGRQTGKTEAVMKYVKNRKERNVIVFVHNTSMVNYYIDKLRDDSPYKQTFIVSHNANYVNRFKGMDLSGYTIIFDEITTSQVRSILDNIGPNLKDISSMKMAAIIY